MDQFTINILAILLPAFYVGVLVITIRWGNRKLRELNRPIPKEFAKTADIPAIVNSLAKHAINGTFVVFILSQPENPKGETVDVQFSVEHKEVGFDWLLDDRLGKRDRSRFEELANKSGWPLENRNVGGCHYIRIRGLNASNIADIGRQVIEGLYDIKPTQEIEIFSDALDWRVGA